MRPISIPRLELQTVTLSVKMYRVLVDELTYKISKATFFQILRQNCSILRMYLNNFRRTLLTVWLKYVKLHHLTNEGTARKG